MSLPDLSYLLGPMSNYPLENRPAFKHWTAELRSLGFSVISPDELDDIAVAEDRSWAGYLRRDIPYLAQCQRGFALPGWRFSKGARLEALILTSLGCPIIEVPSFTVVPEDQLPFITMPEMAVIRSETKASAN